MKQLIVLLLLSLSLAPIEAQYHDKWPYESCCNCIQTDNPYVIRYRDTSRRRYAKIPRRPYLRYDGQAPRWYSRCHIDGLVNPPNCC